MRFFVSGKALAAGLFLRKRTEPAASALRLTFKKRYLGFEELDFQLVNFGRENKVVFA